MSTPISKALISALLLVIVAGCDGEVGSKSGFPKRDAAAGKVECALAGSDRFSRTCSNEQISANGVIMLVIRHPDGGFRRFDVLTDGRGLSPADGFDETHIRLLEGSMIELTSGDDKYHLPAQIKTSANDNVREPAKDAS